MVQERPTGLQMAAESVRRNPCLEERVPDTGLRLFHVWKAQILSLADSQRQPVAARVEALKAQSYDPFPAFWGRMLPDAAAFPRWAAGHWPVLSDAEHGVFRWPLKVDFAALFALAAQRLAQVTGRRPSGDWYLVHADGGDMGGIGGTTMFANMLNLGDDPVATLRFLLPHELNHQVFGAAQPHVGETVVRRIVEEGLCCYVNWLCDERRHPPQEHAHFSTADWVWAEAHEQEVLRAVIPVLDSADAREISRFAQWHVYPWEGAVDRLAYYLGFRLCEAYVRRHGEGAWCRLYELEPRAAWDASGYGELG
ncbi:MAG: hypothetical protein AB1505_21290 [Candidatus Latescibacterota bacterium]